MPKEDYSESLSSSSDDESKPKAKKRKSEGERKEKAKKIVVDSDEDNTGLEPGAYWLDAKRKRRVQVRRSENTLVLLVREFKGNALIDIRELYDGPKGLAPGKKGISLSINEWRKLCRLMEKIDEEISNLT